MFLTSVSSGGTIKASAKCQVTFLTMYGSTDGTRRVLRGQAVSRPADPTSEGHELLGWRLNGADVYDFSAPVMGDLILMAWWGRSLSGSGTAEEPYQIGNAEELVVFRDIVNGANGRKLNSDACAVLTADIVLNDGTFDENGRYTRGESGMWLSEWTPMGQYERTSTAPEGYGGTFDGQGHTIKGLYVSTNAENTHASGLFAQLTGSAVVQNVTVTGYIYVHGVGGGNVGGIAGEANGAAIRNCRNLCDILLNKVDGSTSGVQINAGGIAGSSSGTIENCRNDGTLRTIAPNADGTMGRVGGIVGMSDRGTIRGCVNTGTISGGISRDPKGRHGMGGILGVSFDASLIQDCYNTGSIQEEGRYGSSVNVAGGIVGDMRDGFTPATIRNCYNVGEITGGGSISNEGIVENCWYLTGGSGSGTAKAAAAFADGTVLQALIAGRGDDAHPWDTDCDSKRLAENGMRIPVLAWQGLETVHSGGTATCLEPAACDYCGRSYGDIDPDNHASGGEEQWITTADSHLKKWSCCGAVTVAESGHTWGAWTSDGNDRHTRRCTVNGCRQSETARCSGGTATCVERAVCAACGAAYGAVDSKNHTALVKVNGRPATPTQVGYVTCWTCEDCGRYFRDAAGTQEIRKEDASIGKAEAAGASGSVRSARTADEGAVGLWIAAASGAAMALAGAAIRRRRHAK